MSETDVYEGLEPREVWRHFGALNRIPRPSGREAAAREYVLRAAAEAGATTQVDARGNAVVHVPATPGREGAPPVAIQAHLDMVCEKRPDVRHDFTTDPIRPRVEGDEVYATGTTLGADNGIGAAMALAAMTDPAVEHGPLDLIFTVEEETGLHGAANLDPANVRARMLINLDSEDPRELTIGCAGGAGAILRLPVTREAVPNGWTAREISVSGLKGGHSGVQIHERLASAIKLLTHALRAALEDGVPYRLVSVHGGNAHNAIPRDAAARIVLPAAELPRLEESLAGVREVLTTAWRRDEPGLALDLSETAAPEGALSEADRDRLLTLLHDLPHGVLRMSEVFPGKVETSSNLAMVVTRDAEVEIGTSSRSFADPELEKVQAQIVALGRDAGATIEVRDGYGGWEPDAGSDLLKATVEAYERLFAAEPEVQVIHAGLECGVIASRVPGLEAVSFGPRIRGAHTPEEHVTISSVQSTWKLLCGLLAALST